MATTKEREEFVAQLTRALSDKRGRIVCWDETVRRFNAHDDMLAAFRKMTEAPDGLSADYYQSIARAAITKANDP